jgi:crotonobetainyl-CoA:carnitine CoA-transferase CaiB-like acyl-CoA transferase
MPGPLDDIRVIDCSRGMAGSRATGLLADYGAEVRWIEPPGGDPYRESLATAYAFSNRGKQCEEIDLKTGSGLERLLDLIGEADVFVQTWRPGVAERLGLGYDAIHKRFPQLVYASISGFGTDSAYADMPGHESLVQAVVGAMGEQTGYRPGPIYGSVPLCSMGAAFLSVLGILAALYRRHSDRIGRHVETSMVDGALAYFAMMWGDSDDADHRPPLAPGAGRLVARTLSCADDEFLGVHTGAVGAFGRLMEVLGLENEIKSSPTGVDMGNPLSPEELDILDTRLPGIFASKPRSVWLERLIEADICAIPTLRPTEVFDEAQARHNEMIVTLDDPALGLVEQVGRPIKFPSLELPDLQPGPLITASDGTRGTQTTSPSASPAATNGSSKTLLDGVRILDFGAFFAGPYSSRLLADLGAEVIKVEPVVGDQLRGLERPFISAQAGKRSIALDLKDPSLQKALEALISWADVVHHNMRPGAAERLSIDFGSVGAINPRCIYMHAPGWGTSGPNRTRQSFEPLMSGFVGVSYEAAGQFNPPTQPLCNGDPGNGMVGAIAILMGLLYRERTGKGIYIENPQLNAIMLHLAHIVRRPDGEVLGGGKLDPSQLGISPLDSLYGTADGWICIVAERPAEIEGLGRVLSHPLLSDTRFRTNADRERNEAELRNLISSYFGQHPTAGLVEQLSEAGVPAVVPIQEINSVAFLRNPENHRSGRVSEAADPIRGHVRWLGKFIRISDSKVAGVRPAPGLGDYTYEFLHSVGYSDEELSKMVARRSIRCEGEQLSE